MIGEVSLRRLKSDVLELPPKIIMKDYQMCRKTPAFRHGDIRYNKGKHIEKLVCRHN